MPLPLPHAEHLPRPPRWPQLCLQAVSALLGAAPLWTHTWGSSRPASPPSCPYLTPTTYSSWQALPSQAPFKLDPPGRVGVPQWALLRAGRSVPLTAPVCTLANSSPRHSCPTWEVGTEMLGNLPRFTQPGSGGRLAPDP